MLYGYPFNYKFNDIEEILCYYFFSLTVFIQGSYGLRTRGGFMLFLIDYENVGNAGMMGCDYLNAQDYVIVFYSESKRSMQRRYLESISTSRCNFEICKLCKKGKNALDFYIATRLGEVIGQGYRGISIIVSNDGGFQALRDFWEKKSTSKRKVYISSTIENGIVSASENNQRTEKLIHLRKAISIEQYYAVYKEKLRINTILYKLFKGTDYEEMIDEIQNLVDGHEKNAKLIYLSSLHLFGKKNGLEIYQKLKSCEYDIW